MTTTSLAGLLIGTSGWHYDSWWGPLFPPGLRKSDALSFYAGRFASVELNAPFYRTPTFEAVERWRQQTPASFVFSWKASRFITHWRRLSAGCAAGLELLEGRLAHLGAKAGPVLFQLPPQLPVDRERLAVSRPAHARPTLRLRVPSPQLVCSADPEPARSARRRAVPVGPCGCPGTVGGDGELRLRPRPRADGPLSWQIPAGDPAPVGRSHSRLATIGPSGLLLFRQRPEERSARRCAAAVRSHRAVSLDFAGPRVVRGLVHVPAAPSPVGRRRRRPTRQALRLRSATRRQFGLLGDSPSAGPHPRLTRWVRLAKSHPADRSRTGSFVSAPAQERTARAVDRLALRDDLFGRSSA